jgi:hypothetical protein
MCRRLDPAGEIELRDNERLMSRARPSTATCDRSWLRVATKLIRRYPYDACTLPVGEEGFGEQCPAIRWPWTSFSRPRVRSGERVLVTPRQRVTWLSEQLVVVVVEGDRIEEEPREQLRQPIWWR